MSNQDDIKIVGFGDSHIEMFRPLVSKICLVGGATAYGLTNKNAATRSRDKFIPFLKENSPDLAVCTLGEVDCNSITWMKRKEMKHTELLNLSAQRLLGFLKSLPYKIALSAVPLPPVDAYNKPPFSTRHNVPRKHVTWDKKTLTPVVKAFNEKLKNLCSIHRIFFIDYTAETIGADGTLDMAYAIAGYNVHLNPLRMAPILKRKLDEAISFYYHS